jgi:hypothetical protein
MAIGQVQPTVVKDPSAAIDIGLDLSGPVTQLYQPWLAPGEVVTDLHVTADAGLTVTSQSINTNGSGVPAALLIAWVSGGIAGNTYVARFVFTTNQGRTDSRSIAVQVQTR